MAALSANTIRLARDGRVLRIEASGTVYVGSLLQFDASGHVKPITGATSLKVAGVAATAGKDGDMIEVHRNQLFHFPVKSGDTPDPGDDVYAENDNDVTTTSSARTKVGKVYAEDSDGVWVWVS